MSRCPRLHAAAVGWAAVWLVVAPAGCRAPSGPSAEDAAPAAAPSRAAGSAGAARPRGGGLDLDAAREAHRLAARRAHLRFLEAAEPGFVLRATAAALADERLAAGALSIDEIADLGRIIFEHEHSFADGLGDGDSRARLARGESPFRRVHAGRYGGPETSSCGSCHWRGGPGGAGGLVDASFLYGDGDDVESADPRNPPPLHGVGVVEALALEMSRDLAAIRARAVADAKARGAAVEADLETKGVRFGVLRVDPNGAVDTSHVEGIDADLVVKPFGWKGTFASLSGFLGESLQVHFGIQSEDIVAAHGERPDPELLGAHANELDPDGDGVERELTSGQLAALVSFLALLELPVVETPRVLHDRPAPAASVPAPTATDLADEWSRGRETFERIGCASCHVPMLVLDDPVLRVRSRPSGRVLEIDLARDPAAPGLRRDPILGGYPVWLFSDLKRHDLGESNASRHVDHGVPRQAYLTRRLWGLAKSAPYFWDGRAASIDEAIAAHGGEAATAAAAFAVLDARAKGDLRVYLFSLTRPRRLIVP